MTVKTTHTIMNISGIINCVTHVIFDMDGLLLDTEKIYKHGISTVLGKYGCEYPDDVKAQVLGSQPPDMMRIIFSNTKVGENSGKSRDEIYKEIVDTYTPLMSSAEWMPGALPLVHHLVKHSIPIAIATSSARESFELKTTRHKAELKMFHHIVLGSADPEVKAGKPAPDIFLVAAKRFAEQPDPSKCLVFEDAPNGVIGAKAAKMSCVMVPDPTIPKHRTELADVVIPSLENFRPEWFGLPPFEKEKV
uniref:Probable pseudouridine-5'-phosphatase n=1 Tax=Cacopsylla melanoneura TaxID=428564 RepID=A0A8D8VBE4_9HEMI